MAVARSKKLYEDTYKNQKSPVILAGGSKPTSTIGPGMGKLNQNGTAGGGRYTPPAPGPSATIVKPGQGGSGGSIGTEQKHTSDYLTDYIRDRFSPSSRTEDYADRLDDIENNRPGDFSSKYQDQIDSIVDSILGREEFKTDQVFESDLYNNLREQYMAAGDKAMRDTMGAAQAASGGYGSSFAQSVGQQAYDQSLSQFNNVALDVYDRVYNQYLQEGQELYNQLGMLNQQDSIDYGRYRDQVADWMADRDYYAGRYDSAWGQDMSTYQQAQQMQQWAEQYAYQKTQDALAQQNWQAQFDYQKEQDALAQKNWQTQFDYQREQDALAMELAKQKAARSGGSRGGVGRSSGSKENMDNGYAPIAAGVLQTMKKNNMSNEDAYDYILNLKDKENFSDETMDLILKATGVNEGDALKKKQKKMDVDVERIKNDPYTEMNKIRWNRGLKEIW